MSSDSWGGVGQKEKFKIEESKDFILFKIILSPLSHKSQVEIPAIVDQVLRLYGFMQPNYDQISSCLF